VRGFQVLALIGFFLALCDLFFSQDLLLWLYVALVVALLTATLVRFHRGAGAASYRRSTVLASALLVQALPIAVLLFLFFPGPTPGFDFSSDNRFSIPPGYPIASRRAALRR